MRSQRTSGKMHLKRRIVVCPFALLYNTPKYTNTDFDQTNERFTCDKQQVTYQHNTDMSRSITPYGLCHTERQGDMLMIGGEKFRWHTLGHWSRHTDKQWHWRSGTLSLITHWHPICHSLNIPPHYRPRHRLLPIHFLCFPTSCIPSYLTFLCTRRGAKYCRGGTLSQYDIRRSHI